MLDIAGVALPLGQAIGRWANFVNQELYGLPTNLPWGIRIDLNNRLDVILDPALGSLKNLRFYPLDTTLFHPLFLYESLWNFVAFILLAYLFTRARGSLRYGDIFLLYVMQYSVVRFLLEFIRIEVTLVGGINLSQIVTVVAFVVALVVFIARRRAPTVAQLNASGSAA